MFHLLILFLILTTATVSILDSQCPNNAAIVPYVFELYFLFEASIAEKSVSVEYQKGLSNLFTIFANDYPETRFGVGSFIDKPHESSQDYCYKNHISLSDDRTRIERAFSLIVRGPGTSQEKSSIDGIFYSAIRSATGWSNGDFTTNGRPIFRSIILTTKSKYRQPGMKFTDRLGQTQPKFANRNLPSYDCREEDYASVNQTLSILTTKGIRLLVLAGPSVIDSFDELSRHFDGGKLPYGSVSLLAADDAASFVDVAKGALWKLVCNVQDQVPPYGWCSC